MEYLLQLEVLQVKSWYLLILKGCELNFIGNNVFWRWVALFAFNLLRLVVTFHDLGCQSFGSLGTADPLLSVGLQLAGAMCNYVN